MIQLTKEQEPFYLELKQVEKEMKQAAEQAKVYENSLMLLKRTIKKNQLTVKQLQKIAEERAVYVPLGKAFLRKGKEDTIKELNNASERLEESCKDMEKNQKVYTEKANQKYQILSEGMKKLTKKE